MTTPKLRQMTWTARMRETYVHLPLSHIITLAGTLILWTHAPASPLYTTEGRSYLLRVTKA